MTDFELQNNNNKFIFHNTTSSRTPQEIYKKIRYNQALEIFKIALGFLIARLVFDLLDTSILTKFRENKILYIIVLIILMSSVMYIAVDIFTYLKVENEKDEILQSLAE